MTWEAGFYYPHRFAGLIGMKYLFLEQRAPAGAEENEVTFAFQGARTGMGAWLADAGSGGAAVNASLARSAQPWLSGSPGQRNQP